MRRCISGNALKRVLLAASLVVVSVGCGGGDTRSEPDTATLAAVQSWTGALPASAEQMTTAAFRAFVDGLTDGVGDTADRRCDGPGCAGSNPTATARVRFHSISDAHLVTPDHSHSNGVIVAWFEQLAGPPDLKLRLFPNRTYYVVSLPSRRWRLVELMPGNAGHAWHSVQGLYNNCPTRQDEPPHTGSVARFRYCEESHATDTLVAAPLTLERPPWISCPYGCCTFDPDPPSQLPAPPPAPGLPEVPPPGGPPTPPPE